MPHLRDLSHYYDYIDNLAFMIARKVVEWHRMHGDPGISSRYLVETSYRILESPYYNSLPAQPTINVKPIYSALRYLEMLENHLDKFLEGSISGSEIIKLGGRELWKEFNIGNPLMEIFSQAVASHVSPLVEGKSVLELGGGVGGTTILLQESLKTAREFYFTDIKEYFLDDIRKELPHISMKTSLLNLKKPDFEFPSFDVIFATNVVHVVTDIESALKWIYTHLTPGGKVILGEGSPYSATSPWALELMFSMFDGWWNVLRFPQRPHPGWLLPDQWMAMFSKAAFKRIETEIFMDENRLFGGVYKAEKSDH